MAKLHVKNNCRLGSNTNARRTNFDGLQKQDWIVHHRSPTGAILFQSDCITDAYLTLKAVSADDPIVANCTVGCSFSINHYSEGTYV